MKDTVKKSIGRLCALVKEDMDATDALKLTQAILNLSHAVSTLAGVEQMEKDKGK